MRHEQFEVPAPLRGAVHCLWVHRRESRAQRAQFDVLPDGYAEIIFYFGSPCSVQTGAGWQVLPSPFLMGLLNAPAVLSFEGRLDVIGIRCFPWTVFDLLGIVPGPGGARSIEHPIAALQAPLARAVAAGRVDQALALVEQFCLDAHARAAPDSLLAKAGLAMTAANGSLPVGQVAAAAHATRRTLERKFRQASGHTVKDVSGVMRFEQARNRLWLHPATRLAGLAHELGYTDQSHLSRDFKRYSGMTPAAFARKAQQGQRAVVGDFVAFVQA